MIYEYSCRRGHRFERVLSVVDYRVPQICECGADSRRIISLPRLVTATPDVNYDSPIDGRPITSMAAHRNDLARNGCQLYDPEMKKDADKYRKRKDETLDKSIEESVEKAINAMPAHKREQLAKELSGGADIGIDRRSTK